MPFLPRVHAAPLICAVCLAAAGAATPRPAAAQATSAPAAPADGGGRIERPLSFDSAGRVERLGASLRRQLGLFADVPGFSEARLWEGDDGTFILEIQCEEDGALLRRRRVLTPAALESLRARVDAHFAASQDRDRYDRSGRGQLIFDSIALSLAVYGPSVPFLLDIHSGRPALATYMLTSAAGFYLPYRLTQYRDVSPAHRQLVQYGATRGLLYGGLLKYVLMGEGESRAFVGFANAASLGGAWLSYRAVGRGRYSHGQAELVGVMGDFGLAGGACLASVLGWWDDDSTARAGSGLVLASGTTGLWLGRRLGRDRSYTRGDAYVLRAGGVAGAIAALPLVDAVGADSERAVNGALLAGGVGGLLLSDRALADRDFSFGDGIIVSGGELAGSLLCLGLTYLADTGDNFDSLAYSTAAAVGATGGFTLTLHFLSPR